MEAAAGASEGPGLGLGGAGGGGGGGAASSRVESQKENQRPEQRSEMHAHWWSWSRSDNGTSIEESTTNLPSLGWRQSPSAILKNATGFGWRAAQLKVQCQQFSRLCTSLEVYVSNAFRSVTSCASWRPPGLTEVMSVTSQGGRDRWTYKITSPWP